MGSRPAPGWGPGADRAGATARAIVARDGGRDKTNAGNRSRRWRARGGWRTPCEGRGWMRARWVMGRPRALTRRRRETDLEGFFVVSTAACVKTSGRSSASTT